MIRRFYLLLGLALVGIGFLGYVTPGLPGTVFLIGALYCFKRSSRRFEEWLLHHRWFGPTLRDWDEHHAIRPQTKRVIYAALWASLLVSAAFWGKPHGWAILFAVGLGVTLYIRSLPSRCGVPEPEEKTRP